MAVLIQKYVEVCVFKFVKNRALYLVLHRSRNEAVYPGLWQFVTGSIEEGEHAAVAAKRELKEETGFEPLSMWVVPYVNSFYDNRRDAIFLDPVFAAEVEHGTEPILSAEHEEFEWLPHEKARQCLVWPGQREALRIVQEYFVQGREAARFSQI